MSYLGMVNVNDCPAGLELPAGARNRRKATAKIRRNSLLESEIYIYAKKITWYRYKLNFVILTDDSS